MNLRRISLGFLLLLLSATLAVAGPKICIDPGHGGSDPGAVGNGLYEKNLNLDTALKMKDWFNLDTQDAAGGYDWQILMTRSSDVYVSLAARTSYANSNNVDRFFSIHHDANTSTSANGSTTYLYLTVSSTTQDLGNKTHAELIDHGGLSDRGVRNANFHVLRETSMPAVLTEDGFITNASDAGYISDPAWQSEVSKGFLHALQRHYGMSAYTPGNSSAHIVDNSSSDFFASANWDTATWSSEKYGSNYRYRITEAINDTATWQVTIPQAGNYSVYAWWTAASDRTTAAPYMVEHASGTTTVYKDQSSNGGQWNLLGTFWFDPGRNDLLLSCWTTPGEKVVADAIKWQR